MRVAGQGKGPPELKPNHIKDYRSKVGSNQFIPPLPTGQYHNGVHNNNNNPYNQQHDGYHNQIAEHLEEENHFATSFVAPDTSVFGDVENFPACHYDQRFDEQRCSIIKQNGRVNNVHANPNNGILSNNNYSHSSNSEQHGDNPAVPPPPHQPLHQPPPAPLVKKYDDDNDNDNINSKILKYLQSQNQIDKQLNNPRPRLRSTHNNPNEKATPSFKNGNGGMSITVTQHDAEIFVEDKPATPSRSSQRNDGSETHDSEYDALITRDKDYRSSMVVQMR